MPGLRCPKRRIDRGLRSLTWWPGMSGAGVVCSAKVAQAAHLKDKGQDIEVVSGREFVDLLPGWESAPHDDAAPLADPRRPVAGFVRPPLPRRPGRPGIQPIRRRPNRA